jgi:polyhydroxyalkanoate synthesis repressor PhaR
MVMREAMGAPVIIKKYANRRLYATDESRYVTLEEVAEKVRRGRDIRVIDAADGADLTQVTLTQIILESRGAGRMLPVPFLLQLVRMGDDALAEFFGRYLSAALEVYLAARDTTRGALFPIARLPFSAANPIVRLFSGLYPPYTPPAYPGATGAPSEPPPRGGPSAYGAQQQPGWPSSDAPAPPEIAAAADDDVVVASSSELDADETLEILGTLQRQIDSLRRRVGKKPSKSKA